MTKEQKNKTVINDMKGNRQLSKERNDSLFAGVLQVKTGFCLGNDLALLEGERYRIQEITDYGNCVLVCVYGINRGLDLEFHPITLTEHFKIMER
jgi:hypothetical protein